MRARSRLLIAMELMAASAGDLVRCTAVLRVVCRAVTAPLLVRSKCKCLLTASHLPARLPAAQVSEETGGEPLPEPCIAYVLRQVSGRRGTRRARTLEAEGGGCCCAQLVCWLGRAPTVLLPAWPWAVLCHRRSCTRFTSPSSFPPHPSSFPPHPSFILPTSSLILPTLRRCCMRWPTCTGSSASTATSRRAPGVGHKRGRGTAAAGRPLGCGGSSLETHTRSPAGCLASRPAHPRPAPGLHVPALCCARPAGRQHPAVRGGRRQGVRLWSVGAAGVRACCCCRRVCVLVQGLERVSAATACSCCLGLGCVHAGALLRLCPMSPFPAPWTLKL